MSAPFRSVTVTPTWTRSTPVRNDRDLLRRRRRRTRAAESPTAKSAGASVASARTALYTLGALTLDGRERIIAVGTPMRCLAVCQDELVIRMLDEILLPGFEVEFIVENRPLARRLHDAGVTGHGRRSPPHRHLPQSRHRPRHLRHHRGQRPAQPEEDPRGGARRRRHAGLRARHRRRRRPRKRAEEFHAEFPDVAYLSMSELFGGPLLTEFSRSLTRARVQQYQRYFSDADRVLIMLHNDPDPDAMASGLALRNVLRRTKTTAIIGAIQGVTRPENLRMVNLLDIHVEPITAGVAQGIRPHRDGRRAAALFRRR